MSLAKYFILEETEIILRVLKTLKRAFSWMFMKIHTKMNSAEIRTAYSCYGVTFKNANVCKTSTQSESPSKGQWVHFWWTSTRWEGLTNKKDYLIWSAHKNKLYLSWTQINRSYSLKLQTNVIIFNLTCKPHLFHLWLRTNIFSPLLEMRK